MPGPHICLSMACSKASGISNTASVPLDQAKDIIQNQISEMSKQKAETESNGTSHTFPPPKYVSFLAVININLELPYCS